MLVVVDETCLFVVGFVDCCFEGFGWPGLANLVAGEVSGWR